MVLGAFFIPISHTRKDIMANESQYKLKTLFIATRGVEEYRQSIQKWVLPSDYVLEIGCEWGTTSVLLHEVCKNLIATDISPKCIAHAKKLYQGIRFETLDAFNIKDAMRFGVKFSKIYIDMSGLSSYRALLDVIALVNMYASVFTPAAIIIKSGALKHFATHCILWTEKKQE